jgi:hypothetical protein
MSRRGRSWRFGRVGRRPDHWSTPHERARTRAAERLHAPLAAREEAWLAAHLAGCVACRAIADMYAKDQLALRKLRETSPEPPRDLWARTAARIERESAAKRARRPLGSPQGLPLPVLGGLSGVAVVAVVVVATAVSGGFLNGVGQPAASSPVALASQVIPLKAALEVDAGTVHWLGAGEDGAFAYNVAHIDVVCPHDRQPDCAPFEDGHAKRVTLTATPRFVFQSPVDAQAVVVGTDSTGADAVIVVPLPTPDPTPEAIPTASAGAAAAFGDQPASPVDVESSTEPTPTPSILISATSTLVPIPSVGPSAVPDASDPASPEPTPATAVAIITDVAVVGRTAAYSPDGAWFAFSARPADGSTGPDIYVWHVGDPLARPLTVDHASVFASWVGQDVLGSRVGPVAAVLPETTSPQPDPTSSDGQSTPDPTIEVPPPVDVPTSRDLGQVVPPAQPSTDLAVAVIATAEQLPQTFLMDPATGAEIDLLDAEWQPAVDPMGHAVVAWQGTVGIAGDGLTASPATGNLVLHPFHGPIESEEPFASPAASAAPSIAPSPSLTPPPSVDPSAAVDASPSPEVMRDFPPQIVASGPIADFDVRWDETGTWLAIWIADPVDPGLGRLSLLHFDPFTGTLDRPEGAPQDATALPGFSIGLGRLAWASPPGQGGEGSRIQIAAWTEDQVGAIESIPVEGAIVVQ